MNQAIQFTQEYNLHFNNTWRWILDSFRTATSKCKAKILTFSKFLVPLKIPFKDIKLSENMLLDVSSM
jgi:hypothetical protein